MATIVVLDDEESVRTFMRVAVTSKLEGYTVQTFEDTRPSLQEVDFYDVDLVITDLRMPTPIEDTISSIREANPDVPMVVMSGDLPNDVRARLKDLGVQDFLQKPFPLPLLFQVIDRWACALDS